MLILGKLNSLRLKIIKSIQEKNNAEKDNGLFMFGSSHRMFSARETYVSKRGKY